MLACDTLWPNDLTLRCSAVDTTTLGLSTWHAITSQPASTSALVASASRTGNDQSPVKTTCTVAFGLTLRAPIRMALMVRSTIGIGLAATYPSLPDLLDKPAATPFT